MGEVPQSDETGFRYVLAQRDFRLIWFAQLASQLADKFLMFSLVILAYRLSGGSTPVAFTLLAYTVPAVLIAPLAGVFADRHDRKLIMWSTNFARGLLIAMIPIASTIPQLQHDFIHLLGITFLMSAVGQLFSPAEAAAIPSLLPRPALITANSMVLMTMVLTLVVGGTLAPIVSRVDIYAPYWWSVTLFCMAGVLILFARIPKQKIQAVRAETHPFRQLAVDMKEGWDVLQGSPVLLISFFQMSVAVLVMFMLFTLAPAYVSRLIGIQDQDSYVILVPATLGAILSAGLLGQLGRRVRKSRLMVVSMVATGLTLLVMAAGPRAMIDLRFEHHTLFAVSLAFLLGIDFGGLMIPAITLLMERTHDAVRGRVFALLFMVINGATAIPVLVAAALSDSLGLDKVIGGLGLLLAASGFAVSRSARLAFEASPQPGPPAPQQPGRPVPGT